MSTVAGRSMMDVLHDAYHFQEGGMGIPGDNSNWSSGGNMSIGLAVVPTADPPAADTEESDPPAADTQETDPDMPALIDVEYDEDDEDDEESMTIEEGEAAVVRALDFGAMTIDDLNIDMTTIVAVSYTHLTLPTKA